LILQTNVDLGDKKGQILKDLSALVAASLGKPESYVAVSVTDNVSMIFGGSDEPLALGCLYSLGSINKENNGKVQAGVTDALEQFGVSEGRIYINFFDLPRENVGFKRATFAG
jgi:phenylpyruvate tautomerase